MKLFFNRLLTKKGLAIDAKGNLGTFNFRVTDKQLAMQVTAFKK